MMKRRLLTICFALLATLGMGVGLASAANNDTISFSARVLTKDHLTAPTGSYGFRFSLYSANSGGTALWSETWSGSNALAVRHGLFTVNLGTITSFSGVDWNEPNLYLQIQFDSDNSGSYSQTFASRVPVTAVPVALNAKAVGGKSGDNLTDKTANESISGDWYFGGGVRLGSVNGMVKATAGVLGAASAGTDYQAPITMGNLTGTSNQVSVAGGTGAIIGSGVTLSLPQSIATTSSVQFGAITITGNTTLATSLNGLLKTTNGLVSGATAGVDYQAPITSGNLTEATSSVLTITGGTGAILGSGASIQVKQATSGQSGYLSSGDWSVFNSKQAALTIGNITGTTNQVSVSGGTGAIIGSGVALSLPQSIATSSTVQFGLLGINTTPNVKLEVNSGTSNSAGMRFTQLTTTSPTVSGSGKVLSVDTSGNIIFVDDQIGSSGSLPSGSSGQTMRYNGSNWVGTSFLYNDGSAIGIGVTNPAEELTLASTYALGWDNGSGAVDASLFRKASGEIGTNYLFAFNSSKAANAVDLKSYKPDSAGGYQFLFDTSATISTASLLAVRNNGVVNLALSSGGQLQLPTTGSSAGLLIGGDANLYRSAADTLRTDDALSVGTSVTIATALNLAGTSNQVVFQSAGVTGTLTWTPTSTGKTITLPDASGTVAVSASGALSLSSAGALTIADASTATKGAASFNSTNFSTSSGAVNTIQNIATSSSPTFAGLTLNAGKLDISGGASGESTSILVQNAFTGYGGGVISPLYVTPYVYQNITTYSALRARPVIGNSAVVTTSNGLEILDQINASSAGGTGTGSATTQNGILINSLTAGTTANHAINIAGTGIGNDIIFGSDTNLYRSASNTLKTDDALIAGGGITDSSLTSGRVVYAGTSGLMQDSANMAFDTTNGLKLAAGSTSALQLTSTAGTAVGGILFGADTTLYRSGADTLKTDDALIAGGGITNSSLTSGRVVYSGTSGLMQDSANMAFDTTNGLKLAAGSTSALQLSSTAGTAAGGMLFGSDVTMYRTAATTLTMSGSGGSIFDLIGNGGGSYLTTHAYRSDAGGNGLMTYGARGTASSPTAINGGGDALGVIYFNGHDGSTFLTGASITANANGTVSTGVVPTKLVFKTQNTSGTLTQALMMDPAQVLWVGSTADTNLYRYSANNLKTDDTLLVAGNLGIGTNSPGSMLDVAGSMVVGSASTVNTDIKLSNTTNAKSHYIFSDITTGELGLEAGTGVGIKFNTNQANTRMVISSTGNVGIGVTAPAEELTLASTYALGWDNGSGAVDTNLYRLSADYLATDDSIRINGARRLAMAYSGSYKMWNIDNSSGTFRIFNEDYNASGGGTGGVVSLSIDTANDVTLKGIIRPEARWEDHVNGPSGDIIEVKNICPACSNANRSASIGVGSDGGVGIQANMFYDSTNKATRVSTISSARWYFGYDGTLTLSTKGGTATSWDSWDNTYTLLDSSRNMNLPGSLTVSGLGGGSNNVPVYVTSAGLLTTSSSDASMKTNVADLTSGIDPLEAVKHLRGVYFNWLDTSSLGSQREIGLIAQEVEPYFPELVSTNSKSGKKSLDYPKMTAVLIESTKELAKQLETNAATIADLQSKVTSLLSGNISASAINSNSGQDITLTPGSGKVEVAGSLGISGGLTVKASGAQTYSTTGTEDDSMMSGSTEKAAIGAGQQQTVVTIPDQGAADYTVNVTWLSDPGQPYWVTVNSANTFTVKTSAPLTQDAVFRYMIVKHF